MRKSQDHQPINTSSSSFSTSIQHGLLLTTFLMQSQTSKTPSGISQTDATNDRDLSIIKSN
jgi:hypothetical protein